MPVSHRVWLTAWRKGSKGAEGSFWDLVDDRIPSLYGLDMNTVKSEDSSSAIWQRTIEATGSKLDAPAARALLRLKFAARDLKRADELAAKARTGALTAQEEQELEDYRAVGTALELLKSRARLALKGSSL